MPKPTHASSSTHRTHDRGTPLARAVFYVSGVYGLVTLVPTCFLEARIGTADPPPITHPEYFYGFLGIALAWQVLFILIARDPLRLRPAMPAAVLEKAAFGIAVIALFVHHRVSGPVLALGCIDLLLGAAMTAVYVGTARLARTP